jgi:ribosomal protein S18 acetylase RimI-like enzyme
MSSVPSGERKPQENFMLTTVPSSAQYRRFICGDAEQINSLFKLAYGPSYPYKIREEVPSGAYYAVATDETGIIVGFARSRWLEAEETVHAYPGVHELGGYVVHPEFRRRGIGERLSALCEAAAMEDRGGIHIAHSEPVCWGNGLASQRIFSRHNFRPLGMSVLKYPRISPEHHGEQPASMVLVARCDQGTVFVERPRYLPDDYEELVRELLAGCIKGESVAHVSEPPVVSHAPVVANGSVGAEIVDVPANWPGSLERIAQLRKEGYSFSGYLVEHGRCSNGDRFDYLRLYRPPLAYQSEINWNLIGLIPEWEYLRALMRP